MNRRRWLRAQWPFDIKTLAERLKALQFTTDAHSGFIVDKVRSEFMEGRFIERQEISQVVESPLGQTFVYERTEFRELAFIAELSLSSLEVIDPPRSITVFLSRLAEACGFTVSVSVINVDVIDWCERLSSSLGRQTEIVTCQLRDIKIAHNITANAVIKGNSDVRTAALLVAGGNPFTNEKIKIRIDGAPFENVILTRQGSATIRQHAPDALLSSLRSSLFSSAGIQIASNRERLL